jgi:hypothetical protein
MFKILTVEELADDAFTKAERVKAMEAMNTPTDYKERRKAFIELATARKAANEANARMLAAIEAPVASVREHLGVPDRLRAEFDPFGPPRQTA